MACNCKNANKLEQLADKFPMLRKPQLKGVVKMLNVIMVYITRIIASLFIFVLVPLMFLFIASQVIMKGSVALKVPEFLKEK